MQAPELGSKELIALRHLSQAEAERARWTELRDHLTQIAASLGCSVTQVAEASDRSRGSTHRCMRAAVVA